MSENTSTDMLDGELDLYEESYDYDPLDVEEEKDDDEKAETFGYKGTPEEAVEPQSEAPQLPASERIARLFEGVPPFRRWFITIMDACRGPRSAAEIEDVVEGLSSKRRSVYSPASFCTMLESAGALERITADGEPYEEVEPELVEVEENGRKYLRPAPAPEPLWRATSAALEVLEADDPLGTLMEIVDEERAYTSVFREILEMCEGEGSPINQIREQVNANPVLEYPKKTAQFFMDYLDRNGAITWDGAWKITQVGEDLLERLEKE